MTSMEVIKTSREIVYEGWLIKSPPTKLWRARWRKRWFALRHSGELPGQYFLEYYTDRRCRKLKGHIDLDQCEQVDAGLRFENRKLKYPYVFNIKTPKRIYYLVAESEVDMNKWVDAVCQVCGLKAYTQDEEQPIYTFETQESPPISPASTISGPYIPISECISGRRLTDNSSLNSHLGQTGEHYDAPRKLAASPPQSPTTTDAESVFTDDEWAASIPSVNWDTFPSSSDSKPPNSLIDVDISSWSVCKRFGKLKINDVTPQMNDGKFSVPPRPPKPAHMNLENTGHNYLNLDSATESSKPTTPTTPAPSTPAVNDETYDFPRFHQPNSTNTWSGNNSAGHPPRHCYSNAAPSVVDDRVFRYDFHDDEPSSPHSENSTTATYSNLASPFTKDNTLQRFSLPPPVVNRELKPGRKMSDSMSIISNELSPGPGISAIDSPIENLPTEPPSINRKLKPSLAKITTNRPLQLASPPGKSKGRASSVSPSSAPVYVTRHHSTSDEDNNANDDKEEIYYYQDRNIFIPASNRQSASALQYLDLDLENNDSFNMPTQPTTQASPNTTVYKTVDFLKTDAFNRTRQRVEEERKRSDELI